MNSRNFSSSSIDFRSLLKPYIKNRIWFFLSVGLALVLGFIYIRYAEPQFAIQSKIKILDAESPNSELGAFKEIELLGGGGREVADEIEILGSRTNIIEVIRKLGLNKKITALGNIRNSELYLNQPFNVNFLAPDSIVHNANFDFYVTLRSDTAFEYSIEEDDPAKLQSYGKTFDTPIGEVIITPNNLKSQNLIGTEYEVSVRPLAMIAEIYQLKIKIAAIDELTSNILTISLEDAIKERGKNVLNTLIDNYNQNAIELSLIHI